MIAELKRLFVGQPLATEQLAHERLSKRIALMTENWFFPSGDFQLLSGGLRFRGGRLTVDLAFLTSPDAFEDLDGVPLIPWLSFSYHFDGRGERAASASK